MKTFNTSSISFRSAIMLAGAIACLGQAEAQKRMVKNGKKAKASLFDPGELGATRGKFETWKRGVLGGDAFYTKVDRSLKSTHATICDKVQKAMIEGRVGDEAGWTLIDEVIAVGKKAKEERGNADTLTGSQKAVVSQELQKISAKAKAQSTDTVDPKIATPQLNRRQVNSEEMIRFGKASEMISTAEGGTLERKADRLLDKEVKAKSDGEVSDREHESLMEDAQELSRDLIEALAR